MTYYNSILRKNCFAGLHILITGGGSGIGRCIAHEVAALGGTPLLLGRKEDKLLKVVTELQQYAGEAYFKACDIRDEAQVNATIAYFIEQYGAIHGLVNNAGGQYASPLAMMNQKGFETVVRTNLVGGFLVAKAVFTQSMNKTGGAIVNIVADMWGGMPGMGHSGAARSGMDILPKTAAVEWAR